MTRSADCSVKSDENRLHQIRWKKEPVEIKTCDEIDRKGLPNVQHYCMEAYEASHADQTAQNPRNSEGDQKAEDTTTFLHHISPELDFGGLGKAHADGQISV